VTGVTVVGVRGHLVAVEAHVGRGLPSLTLTGLPGVGVQDARDRSSVTDPAVLRVLLKVREGAGGGYSWVTCGGCEGSWQVPHYAESVR
jgi:hypothetical protein